MDSSGGTAVAAAAAAVRVCTDAAQGLGLPTGLVSAATNAFGDAGLALHGESPSRLLVEASRRILQSCGGEVAEQELDASLCELLAAIWADAGWHAAWADGSLGPHCPLREILAGARCGLSYGGAEANRKYFKQFGRLAVHATMLQDRTRTSTYQRAIHLNRSDFEGKTVMDVGSGTGLLAFFALQAGAAKVYCIEASQMADVIRELADVNGFRDRIVIINKVLQDIRDEVPEEVDVITHETLGNFLFAERGIETVLVARRRFLKPNGLLFPAAADFCLAPFEDARTYNGRLVKSKNLWTQKDFFGIDLSCLHDRSLEETFNRPVFDQFHPDVLKAEPLVRRFDFRTMEPEDVRCFEVPFSFASRATCVLHGVAGWFEAIFEGSSCSVVLSTSPWDTLTHWWQMRLMLLDPLAVNKGQTVDGSVAFVPASETNTYICKLTMASGGVRREQDGYNLADVDSATQVSTQRVHQIGPHEKVQMLDWEATKAVPSTTAAPLISDPLAERKAEALRSQEAAAGRGGTAPGPTEGSLASTAASPGGVPGAAERIRPLGTQIRVQNQLFIRVEHPSLCQQLVDAASSSGLALVGSLGSGLLLAPPSRDALLEMLPSVAGGPMRPHLWLELQRGLQHMRVSLRQCCKPAPFEEDLNAMEPAQLVASYVAMHKIAASADGGSSDADRGDGQQPPAHGANTTG